jgi:penicillin-binding protein 1A
MKRLRISTPSLLCALAWLFVGCAQLENLPKLSRSDLRFKPPQSSRIYSSDGQVLTTLHRTENRTVIPLDRIPKKVRDAVVAIEDKRFFEHDGVDLRAIVRAAIVNATSGEVEEGGSTITQQYVKQVIISPGETAERTIERKIDEAALARQIEQELSKREILGRYLNTVYFGNGAYGIQTAARTYFAKSANQLTLAQGALLAGLIRAPSSYDPYDQPRIAKARRNTVLDRMVDQNLVPRRKAARGARAELGLRAAKDRTTYPAAYFVDYVQRLIKYDPRFKALGRTVRQRENQLLSGGLEIHTTVDLAAQDAAEDAVSTILDEETDPYGALVAIDPDTGEVKAMVGGRDFFARPKEDRFGKLNMAILSEPRLGDASACGTNRSVNAAPGCGRQAGSSFKTFALVAALEQGAPLSRVYDAQECMTFVGADAGEDWSPCNYEEAAYGPTTLLEATINSVNVVYAQLAFDVGPENVVESAHDMGITTELSASPSIVLGTSPVNPLNMASAYGTLATNGTHHRPVAITRIEDARGKVIYEDDSIDHEVIDPAVAYTATTALERVIQEGTGVAANIGRPAAGKTGTAQDYTDAWFAGYTPDLAAAVWVGYPAGKIGMQVYCSATHNAAGEEICRPTERDVTGGSWPAEIWRLFMSRAMSGVPVTDFEVPEGGITTIEVDSRTGCPADESTPEEFVEEVQVADAEVVQEECVAGPVLVPNVVGYPADEATAILQDEGFVVSQTAEDSSYPPDTVVEQSPAGGTEARAGATVTLVVSD